MRFFNAIILISIVLFINSCNNDDVNYPTNHRFVDIVTVIKNNKGMKLEKVALNDQGVTTLITNQWVDAYLAKGRRVIVEYEVSDENITLNPMPVNLIQIGLIAFDTIKYAQYREIELMERPKAKLVSAWRTGDFINLQTELKYDGNNQMLSILADESTKGKSIVECYLYNKGEIVGENSIDRHTYCSYYIGDVWDSSTIERIRLYTNGIDDKKSYVDILKNSY